MAEPNSAEVEVEQIMPRIRAELAQRALSLPGLHAPSALSRIVKHTVEAACSARGWKKGDGFMLEDVPSAELRRLYTHARPTICPSFAEGSDLVGVEVMMSWGAVVASDIPVHREVNAEAAEYFNRPSLDEFFQMQARTRIRSASIMERRAKKTGRQGSFGLSMQIPQISDSD